MDLGSQQITSPSHSPLVVLGRQQRYEREFSLLVEVALAEIAGLAAEEEVGL
jgi:hypothetical protein